MGYYTYHQLEVLEGDQQIIAELISENDEAAYALNEDGGSAESCKWYHRENDFREFSKKHPDVLFRLSGEGEEAGDIWSEYYRNGKMQHCKAKVVIPDFNEDLLK